MSATSKRVETAVPSGLADRLAGIGERAGRVPLSRLLSTRVRIFGGYMVLLALAMGLALFVQRSILINQMGGNVDTQLRQEVDELRQLSIGRNPATGQPFGNDVGAIFNTFLTRNIPTEGEALFTLIDGRPHASTITPVQLLDDREVVSTWAAVETTTRGEIDTSAGPVRWMAVPVVTEDGTKGVFVVAFFLKEKRDDINRVLRTGGMVYGTTFLAATALAWLVAGRVLRPLRLLTDAAQSITDDNWTERIPVRGEDEIAELTRTFNDMLDRLEASFATQRRFIDDAGHELRTPITIIRGHLELMSDDPDERRETVYMVMDELDRMSRLVDDLLLLARSEQPDFLDLRPVDVAELTEEVAAKAGALAPRWWSVGESAKAMIIADRQRLTQALMNLVRNAADHSPEGSPITIGSRVAGNDVHLWVKDEGEGIPLADRERIFARFSRGKSGRRSTEGAGLGLSIVQAIAEAHGGRVMLQSAVGAGSTFTLVLPIDGPEEDIA